MKRSITRVIVLLVAGLLVSCGGGGGGGDTPSGDTPSGGTPSGGTPGGGTPPGNGGGSNPPGNDSGGTAPGNDSGGTPPGNDGGGTPGNGSGGGTGTLPSAGAHVEESDPAVTLSIGWEQSDRRFGWSRGDAVQSIVTGATASFAFNGTSVRWIGSRGTNRGIALVKVDGGQGFRVNLYSKAFEVRTPVLTIDGLTDGPHTLTIEVTGLKHAAASSNVVVVDAFEVQAPIVSHLQETDPDASFSAGWVHLDSGQWSGGGVKTFNDPARGGARATQAAGEKMTLRFRGTSISWIGRRGPDAGIARVQVDGVEFPDVDLYARNERIQEVVFTASGLADTGHTLTIETTALRNEASTGTQIVVDAFDVTTPGRRYQEKNPDPAITDHPITYTGLWNDDNLNRVWSEGEAATTSEPGASATFSFTGTSVSWIGCEKSSIGRAEVYIDDVFKERVNMNRAVGIEGYQRTIRRYDGLSNGPHKLKIVAVSGITVVDAFDVHP